MFETILGPRPPWHISRVGVVRGRRDHHAVRSSWTLQESQVESSEYQDNSYIHYQPFPEPVSEKQEIYTDYDGYHQQSVKHASCLSFHFESPVSEYKPFRNACGSHAAGPDGKASHQP